MSDLEQEKQRILDKGKEEFIKELVLRYSKFVNQLSVIDIIKDHLELKDEYQDLHMLNRIRKMDTRKARIAYIKKYERELRKQNFKNLIKENI